MELDGLSPTSSRFTLPLNRIQEPVTPNQEEPTTARTDNMSDSDSEETIKSFSDEEDFKDEYINNIEQMKRSKCLINPEGRFYTVWNILNSFIIVLAFISLDLCLNSSPLQILVCRNTSSMVGYLRYVTGCIFLLGPNPYFLRAILP